jgi:hypothetical protein
VGYTVTENRSEYDRGVAAGEIATRLQNHEEHLSKINGSMEDVAHELSGVKLTLQRMADSMDADRRTVVTTAEALKQERESTAAALASTRIQQKETAERRWTPFQRGAVIIGAIAATTGLLVFVLTHITFH